MSGSHFWSHVILTASVIVLAIAVILLATRIDRLAQ